MENINLDNIVSNLYHEIGFIFGGLESFRIVLEKNNINELLYNAKEYVEMIISINMNDSFSSFFINYFNHCNSFIQTLDFFNNFINKYEINLTDEILIRVFENKAVMNFFKYLDEDILSDDNNLLSTLYGLYYVSDVTEDNTYSYSNDSEKDYLNRIKRIKVYDTVEEKMVFLRLQELMQDEVNNEEDIKKLKNEIVYHNLRLVANIAKKEYARYRLYDNPSISLLDLIQEGNIALTEKLDRFDVNRGTKFSTFIINWIRQAIDRSIEEFGKTIRIPSYQCAFQAKVNRIIEEHFKQYGSEPTDKILIDVYGIDKDMLSNYRKAAYVSTSLDKPLNDEEQEATIGDFTPDEDMVSPAQYSEKMDLKDRIHKMALISSMVDSPKTEKSLQLRKRDVLIFETMFGLKDGKTYTLDEVAKMFGISRQRVRIVVEKIIRRIKKIDPTCEKEEHIPNIYDSYNSKIENFKKYCTACRNNIVLVSYNLPSGVATLECDNCGNVWTEKINNLGKTSICMKCALAKKESCKTKESIIDETPITTERQALFALSRYTHIGIHELEIAFMEISDEDKLFLISKLNKPKTSLELKKYNDLVDRLRTLSQNINAKIRLRKRRYPGSDNND